MQPTPTSTDTREETGFRGLSYGQQYAFTGSGPVDTSEYPGALICVEGTDRVGLRASGPELAVFDDQGRLLWLDAVSGRSRGPWRVV